MRRRILALILALAGCAPALASKKKGQAAARAEAEASAADAGDEVMKLPEEPAPASAPAAANEEDAGLRPPTEDLPKAKRDALVKEQLARGDAALRAHEPDGAIRAAHAALDVDETSVEAMIMLAHGFYLKGYDDKAEAVLNIAKKRPAGATHPVLWMLLGLVNDRAGREDQALAAYEKATQLKPDYLAALTNRGAIYLKRKRYRDAIQVFEQVVQVHGDAATAHLNLGSAYRGRSADFPDQPEQRERLLKKAEAEYKTAMSEDPKYAPAYFNLGILYLDADPFPGLLALQRYQLASKYLSDYKRAAGPAGIPAADEYLVAAQKGIEREQKILELKRRNDARRQKKGGGS